MAALYAEEQGWPDVQKITIEDYLSYLQDRVRWFGERIYAEPKKLSKGHINAQYRRLNRFFNWLVERKHIDENPLADIEPPSLEEKTVPIVTEDQMRDLLTLADPALAKTPAHRFRLSRDRAVLYAFWHTPGRLSEIVKLELGDVDLNNGTLLVMGKGRKERRMPIGDAARSVMWGYLQERESLTPRTKALWVSEQGEALLPNGICQLLRRPGKANQHQGHAPAPVPPLIRHQRSAGWHAGAGPENSRRVEEDTRDVFPDAGGRGRERIPPPGEPGRLDGGSDVCAKDSTAAE